MQTAAVMSELSEARSSQMAAIAPAEPPIAITLSWFSFIRPRPPPGRGGRHIRRTGASKGQAAFLLTFFIARSVRSLSVLISS